MAINDITETGVKAAIKEYDKIGLDEMFRKYGGGPSKQYNLVYKGKCYPQKLIARVAHGYLPWKQSLEARGGGTGARRIRNHLQKLALRIGIYIK